MISPGREPLHFTVSLAAPVGATISAARPGPERRSGFYHRSNPPVTDKVEPGRHLGDRGNPQRDLKHFQFFSLLRRKVQGIGGRFALTVTQHVDLALNGTPRQNQPAYRGFVRRIGCQRLSQRQSVLLGRLHQRPQSLRIVPLHHHEGF